MNELTNEARIHSNLLESVLDKIDRLVQDRKYGPYKVIVPKTHEVLLGQTYLKDGPDLHKITLKERLARLAGVVEVLVEGSTLEVEQVEVTT